MWRTVQGWWQHGSGLGMCLLCQQACATQPLLCDFCYAGLHRSEGACPLCATPQAQAVPCDLCNLRRPAWDRLQVIGPYVAPYPSLIHQFKYHGDSRLAPVLAALLHQQLDVTAPLPEVLLPVPLHWQRRLRRGFNQATLLAQELGQRLTIPVDTHTLRRCKATVRQASLPQAERALNLADAFVVKAAKYRHVAIVDDVVTTGATVTGLVDGLRRAGVQEVEVWALCRTLLT